MSKVRARPETGTLYLDFFYRGVRCREQTALEDTPVHRRRVQTLLNRIEGEIKQGLFDYAATFPASPKAKRFAAIVGGQGAAPANVAVPTAAATVL